MGSLKAIRADLSGVVWGPVEALFVSRDDPTSRFDGVATPLFAFAALALWAYRRHPWVIFAGVYIGAAYLCSAFFGRFALRELTTLFLPIVSLTVLGLGRFTLFFKRRLERRVVTTLLAAHLLFVALYLADRIGQTGAIEHRSMGATPRQYLLTRLSPYPMIEFINRNIGSHKYVLSLYGGGALFYYTPRVITGGTSPLGHLPAWLRTAPTGRAVAREFSVRGIDYLVSDETALEEALRGELSDRELGVWREFMSTYTTTLHTATNLTLREIYAAPTAPPPEQANK